MLVMSMLILVCIVTSDKGGGTCFCPCLFVRLSVCLLARSLKNAWMKSCVSTDVGTWTNWLAFEPDPDHNPDAGTGLLAPISYRLRNFAALPRLPASCTATRNFTSGKSHVYTCIGGAPDRTVVLKWFYSLSRRKTFVEGKCALPSALVVIVIFILYACYSC